MPTLRPNLLLTLTLLIALSASCVPQAMNTEVTPSPPTVPPADSPFTITLIPSTPGKTLEPQRSQFPEILPSPSFIPINSILNLILGRPTTDSITASVASSTSQLIVLAYGVKSGNYTHRTSPVLLQAAIPQNIEITQLNPNTTYYHEVISSSITSNEHTFHTQRAPGSTFTFTIDANPHNHDPRFNGELYATALTNALADHPDFHINLGDTFMTEKLKPQNYTEAESTFSDMRPYFSILSTDAPLFLVNGNREGELGWLLKGKDFNVPIWSTQLRRLYYPNPTPNGFYTGGSTSDIYLGSIRDGYFAWTWGDAQFVVLDPFWYTTSKPKPDDLNNNWSWTIGKEQYDWLKSTLETSDAKFISYLSTTSSVAQNWTARRAVVSKLPISLSGVATMLTDPSVSSNIVPAGGNPSTNYSSRTGYVPSSMGTIMFLLNKTWMASFTRKFPSRVMQNIIKPASPLTTVMSMVIFLAVLAICA